LSSKITVLILHGWGSSSASWVEVKTILENNGFSVFTPDLPGFGKNKPPSSAWGVDDYVNWTLKFIEEKNLGRIFLLGHSFGGRIAIKLAAKYPEKLASLILVSGAGIKHQKTFWQRTVFYLAKIGGAIYILTFLPSVRRFIRKFFYRYIVRRKDYFEANGVMRETFSKVIDEDLTPFLNQINVPTLLVWGEKDKMTPLTDAYLMTNEIKSSILKIIPGNGHALNLDAPQKLTEAILKFLNKT